MREDLRKLLIWRSFSRYDIQGHYTGQVYQLVFGPWSLASVYPEATGWVGRFEYTSRFGELYHAVDHGILFDTAELAQAGITDHAIDELERLYQKSYGEPVAEICSAHGDPEAFGERELRTLVDIQKFPYNTKLYVKGN